MGLLSICAVLQVESTALTQTVGVVAAAISTFVAMKAYNASERKSVDERLGKKADKIDLITVGEQVKCCAEKDYVDQQDRAIHKRINEVREDNKTDHREIAENMNNQFKILMSHQQETNQLLHTLIKSKK